MPTTLHLSQETDLRLERLASATGRTKDYHLRELVERGLEDVEDYYAAVEVMERVRRGDETVSALEDVERSLGLAD